MRPDRQASKGPEHILEAPRGMSQEEHAKNLKLGDPFDDAANRAAFAEKQKQEEERRQKLIDFRKKKEQLGRALGLRSCRTQVAQVTQVGEASDEGSQAEGVHAK